MPGLQQHGFDDAGKRLIGRRAQVQSVFLVQPGSRLPVIIQQGLVDIDVAERRCCPALFGNEPVYRVNGVPPGAFLGGWVDGNKKDTAQRQFAQHKPAEGLKARCHGVWSFTAFNIVAAAVIGDNSGPAGQDKAVEKMFFTKETQ